MLYMQFPAGLNKLFGGEPVGMVWSEGGATYGCSGSVGCTCATLPCAVTTSTIDPNNGSYVMQYQTDRAGSYSVAMTLSGGAIKSSPVTIPVIASALSIPNSTYTLKGALLGCTPT